MLTLRDIYISARFRGWIGGRLSRRAPARLGAWSQGGRAGVCWLGCEWRWCAQDAFGDIENVPNQVSERLLVEREKILRWDVPTKLLDLRVRIDYQGENRWKIVLVAEGFELEVKKRAASPVNEERATRCGIVWNP